MSVINRIQKQRIDTGLTQEQLAEKLSVSDKNRANDLMSVYCTVVKIAIDICIRRDMTIVKNTWFFLAVCATIRMSGV